MQGFLGELKRRNVLRVAGIYLAGSWLLAQVAGLLGEWFHWPEPVLQFFFIALGLGLPIALIAAWLFEITPEGVKLTNDVERSESIRPVTGRKLDRILIGVLGALVLVLLADRMWFIGAGDVSMAEAAPAGVDGTAAATAVGRIAVLPFVNISSDPEQETFVDGLTVEVWNALARVSDLELTGRTSSFYYKGRNEDARAIGATLGVTHIVEGAARKSGDRVRIDVQLTDTASGTNVWASSYDRPLEDFITVQEDIARSVSRVLQVSLGVGDVGRQPGMTRNVEAYETYLNGVQNGVIDTAPLIRALNHLERAVAIDASFAQAWAELANVYSFAATLELPGNTPEAWAEKADGAFGHVRDLLPDSLVARELQADRSMNLFDWKDAHRQFEQISAEFGYAPSQALFLLCIGRFAEARSALERATLADPLHPFLSGLLAQAHAGSGNLSAAIAEIGRGKRIAENDLQVQLMAAFLALATGDRTLIDEHLGDIPAGDDPRELMLAMRARLDNPADALMELQRRAVARKPIEAYAIPLWHAYFGDDEGGLNALRAAFGDRKTTLRTGVFFLWHPLFTDARKLPAFKDLVRDIGLVDYWREYGWPDVCRPVSGTDDFECS